MAEQSWHEARLIPTSGINGAEEQERRATSALLAVMTAVKEYGRALIKPLGAPAGTIETYSVAATSNLGPKRGRGRGSFIDSVLTAVDSFYAEVLQDLKAWSATPPKLRSTTPTAPADAEPTKPASLSSTDYSSQDGPGENTHAAQITEAHPDGVTTHDGALDGSVVEKSPALTGRQQTDDEVAEARAETSFGSAQAR